MAYGRLKLAIATAILVMVAVVVVEGADKSVKNGPYCIHKSVDKVYNRNAERLMDILVDETKNVLRKTKSYEDYRYYHSYPNKDLGSVLGGGFCDRGLTKWGCGDCLGAARDKIKSGCDRTFEASVQLADCALWFRAIALKEK